MSRLIRLGLSLWLPLSWLGLAGCSTVLSEQPVGVEADPASAAELAGEWKAEKGRVRFTPGADGHMTVTILPPQPGRAGPPPFDVALRHSDALRYVNLRDPDDADAPGYLFLRYRRHENGHIVAWIPATKVFRDAVAEGRLAGEMRGNRISRVILITATQTEIDAFLAGLPDEAAWETDNPVVIWNPDAPDTPK